MQPGEGEGLRGDSLVQRTSTEHLPGLEVVTSGQSSGERHSPERRHEGGGPEPGGCPAGEPGLGRDAGGAGGRPRVPETA